MSENGESSETYNHPTAQEFGEARKKFEPIILESKSSLTSIASGTPGKISAEKAVTRKLLDKNSQIESILERASRDDLTNLLRRDSFMEVVKAQCAQVDRDYSDQNPSSELKHGLLFAVGDLDDFGTFNKKYGTDNGDKVLVATANSYLETIRESDVVGRLGGEEFGTSFLFEVSGRTIGLEKHLRPLEDLKTKFADIQIPGVDMPIRSSFGVTRYRHGESIDDIYSRASKATMVAKLLGKNRIVSAEPTDKQDELVLFDTSTDKEYLFWNKEGENHLKYLKYNQYDQDEHYVIRTIDTENGDKKTYLEQVSE